MGKIAIIGCFDTKAEVFQYLYQELTRLGSEVIAMNTGIFGTTDRFPVAIENHSLAALEGRSPEDLAGSRNRNEAVKVMAAAARKRLKQLADQGEITGVIGMGGGGGTYIVLEAMQDVPFGIPKWCVSTLATKDVADLVGSKDIFLVPSIVDVAGLNSVISVLIRQVAVAAHHLSELAGAPQVTKSRVAISMFGNTTRCVDLCTAALQAKGFEVFAFHANGSGGKVMEEMIRGGYFEAVLDVTTTELADDLCGGICSAGPSRLTAAGSYGIPQVVVPGCLDMVNFGRLDSVPDRYRERNLYEWSPDVTLLRTNVQENRELGARLVGKLLAADTPVVLVLPLKGISEIDREGGVFHSAEANGALFAAIRSAAGTDIPVLEKDYHINDPEFAAALVTTLLDCIDHFNPNNN